MDDPRTPVTMTAAAGAKRTMSRSFLIDSLIGGGAKRPSTAAAAAVPYHPLQLNEYIQFLNRTAAAAYAYQSPGPVAFPPSVVAASPRFFGYPMVGGGGGGFAKDHPRQPHVKRESQYVRQQQQQPHAEHEPQDVVKPTAVMATGAGVRNDYRHQQYRHNNYHHHVKSSAKKRPASDVKATIFDPGECPSIFKTVTSKRIVMKARSFVNARVRLSDRILM